MKIGTLHDKDSLFFRVYSGEAKDKSGRKYELSVCAGKNSPIIRSEATGLWFTLSWTDIINLAKDSGIDALPLRTSAAKAKKAGKK